MSSIFLRRLIGHRGYITSTLLKDHQYRNKSTDPKIIYTMNEAFLRYEKGKDVFDISFRFVDPDLHLDKQMIFNRQVSETVNSFLKRIDCRISGFLTKKKDRKKTDTALQETLKDIVDVDNVDNNKIALFKNGEKVDGDVACECVLNDTEALKLVVFDSTYTFIRNAPNIKKISLPNTMLCGFPVYPAKFEYEFLDKTASEFSWYKSKLVNPNKTAWQQVELGFFYIPNSDDIGSKLKLICIPKNEKFTGPMISIESKNSVEAGPGKCLFDTRHQFTKDKLSGKRVVSYNILANAYADSDYSREQLFSYCPAYALAMDYRKHLILKELIGYNSDVICLQEVDSKIYEYDLSMCLETLNYGSEFVAKNEVREGLATFFRNDRFEKLKSDHSFIGQNTDYPIFNEVWSKIENEKMKERFLQRNTTLQITTLRSKDNPSEILIIGNTHLYFHPNADHIRLLQAFYIITFLSDLSEKTREQYPDHNVNTILCGDFNSVPECGVYQLMTENYIPENYKDWFSKEDEAVENVSLTSNLRLLSACGTPEYTNYTPGFSGCLDYIFYQPNNLQVEQVIPMPSTEEITAHTGLPSVVSPSDHISLCADLKFTR